MPEDLRKKSMHAGEDANFATMIVPLEVQAGAFLNGPGRATCFAAFRESQDGFGRCAERALSRARRNALGVLIRMVEAGEHRIPLPQQENEAREAVPPVKILEHCMGPCGQLRPCTDDGDRLLCDTCRDGLAAA